MTAEEAISGCVKRVTYVTHSQQKIIKCKKMCMALESLIEVFQSHLKFGEVTMMVLVSARLL